MRFRVLEVNITTALSRSGLPDLDYALNPYIGCSHGCLYCYAKEYTRFSEVAENWGWVVVVKRNLLDVLAKEVKRVRRGVVGLGTITDAYQPIEALYKLSRKAIELLAVNGFSISIQTKSSLILRDLDVLKRYSKQIDVGFTITSTKIDSEMRVLEPFSSPPMARIEALKRLAREGIKTWVFYGPIVPGFNDDLEEIAEVLQIAKEIGSAVYFDKLRVKKFMWRNSLLAELAKKSLEYNWGRFMDRVLALCQELGVECRYGFEYAEEGASVEHYKTLDEYISRPQ
jgi:DNA repair photolyase